MKAKVASRYICLCVFLFTLSLTSCKHNSIENKEVAFSELYPTQTHTDEIKPPENPLPGKLPVISETGTPMPSHTPNDIEELADDPGYTVNLVNVSSLLNPAEVSWVNHLSFNIIQVEGMKNEALQEKINKNILEATTHWIEDAESYNADTAPLIPSDENCPDIYLQSTSYLSFSNYFGIYNPRRYDAIIDVVTIDMKTGEKVKLTDLFNVNISFAGKIITLLNDIWYRTERITNPDDLLTLLEKASLNNLELDKGMSTRVSAVVSRISFHLREGELRISFHHQGALLLEDFNDIIINVDDLEDFLLVDKW
jgi:hypothetical protein